MDPVANTRVPHKMQLFNFNSPEEIAQYVVGSDADIGGYSSAKLDLRENSDGSKYGLFHGDMRIDVRPQMQGKMRSGYAGFRNKVCNK